MEGVSDFRRSLVWFSCVYFVVEPQLRRSACVSMTLPPTPIVPGMLSLLACNYSLESFTCQATNPVRTWGSWRPTRARYLITHAMSAAASAFRNFGWLDRSKSRDHDSSTHLIAADIPRWITSSSGQTRLLGGVIDGIRAPHSRSSSPACSEVWPGAEGGGQAVFSGLFLSDGWWQPRSPPLQERRFPTERIKLRQTKEGFRTG